METLQLIDLKQICRVCLQSEMLISLYSGIPYSQFLRPIDMIMKLDLFKFEIDDNMPSSICQSCVYRLMDAFTLKQQCEATETHLKEYLGLSAQNSAQFSYMGTKNYISFPEFPDTRFEEENNFPKINYQAGNQITITSTSSISPPIFNTLNCDIFETNNSEDIEVADDVLNEVDESFVDVVGESLVFKINDMKDQIYFESPTKNQENENFNDPSSAKGSSKGKLRKSDFKDTPKPYKCSECLKIFKSNILLDIHMRIHKDIKPYTCEVCNKSFRQIGNFNLHRRIHINDRRFQCEICSRLFSTSSNLKSHIRSHSNHRNFKCATCQKSFKAEIELKRHSQTHKDTKNFFCNICNKGFLNKSYLKSHISSVHENKKKYSCAECNKRFASSSNLIVHQRIHSGLKPFKCKICNAKFNQSQALTRHEKLHDNSETGNLETQGISAEIEENNIDIEKSQSEGHHDIGVPDYQKENFKINLPDYLPNEITTHEPSIISPYKHIQYINNNDILNSSSTILPSYSTGFPEMQTNDLNSIVNTYHHPHSMHRPLMTEQLYQPNYDFPKDINYKNLHRSFE
ncbi:zinc finger protein 329-like [Condylostylus longicornis]|uniref:zinc finger protein 329-like n=1 Tax=Condylostylus longicornis TaxID=2530218 RepID=UPI00244E1751|nr:zinc finger protein 329-like [Condylostylus longicornis]